LTDRTARFSVRRMPRPLEQIAVHHLFAHNAWANARLLDFCERLTPEQLAWTTPGAVGTVGETLHHLVQAEGGYLSRVAPDLVPTHWEPFLAKDFSSVRARGEEMASLWLAYSARDPDPSEIRRKEWPDVTHEFPAYMEMAQALHHSTIHREQVCMILTVNAIEPPDLQPLAWADEIGVLKRIR
jgi:uncharacterized damage-inducible protein DinB